MKMFHTTGLSFLFLILFLFKIEAIIVNTESGPVEGIVITTDTHIKVNAYLGIPYAKPPTGERRFKPPEPVKPWTKVLPGNNKKKACLQAISTLSGLKSLEEFNWWIPQDEDTSEDCLYLNIWVPNETKNNAANYAVLIWIHGGDFEGGTSATGIYDGTMLAGMNNVIVVSVNYRLNVFGFLYLDNDAAPGNVGIRDQALAMKWIKENIGSFGGDTDRITIMGQEAGGTSVLYHLTIHSSKGLFNRAVIQSANIKELKNQTALEISEEIAKECGCKTQGMFRKNNPAKCLREVDAKKLIKAAIKVKNPTGAMTKFYPIVDGKYITDDPLTVISHKLEDKSVNVLIGSNKNDGINFLVNMKAVEVKDNFYIDKKEYHDRVKHILGTDSDTITNLTVIMYSDFEKLDEEQDRRQQLIALATDYTSFCETNQISDLLTKSGHDVFRYQFNHHASVVKLPSWMGCTNWDELDFVFGLPLIKYKGYTSKESILSSKVMKFWTNFAKYGNPNGESEEVKFITWPTYSIDNRFFLRIGTEVNIEHGRNLRFRYCIYLDKLLPKLLKLTENVLHRCDLKD